MVEAAGRDDDQFGCASRTFPMRSVGRGTGMSEDVAAARDLTISGIQWPAA